MLRIYIQDFEFLLFQPVGLPTAEKWKKTINKPNLDNIEKPMSRKKKVSQTQKIPSSPTKKTTETYQRPKKESVARKTSRIEKEENNADKSEFNKEIRNDNENVYNESNHTLL